MAHELDFNEQGKARMFYVRSEGEPWHKLGQAVLAPLTAQEAMQAAKLDWTVSLHPVSNQYGVIDGHFSVVRDDTKETFTVVKDRYTPVQNKEVFGFADSLVAEGMKYHTAGAIKHGRRVWMLAKLPGSIRVIGQDVIDKYLLFSTAHDGSQAVQARFTPVRVVCANTLQQAQVGRCFFSSKHTAEIHTKIREAKDLFIDLRKKEEAFSTACQRMALTPVNDEQIEAFLYQVLGYHKGVEEIPTRTQHMYESMRQLVESGVGTDLTGVRGSLWGVYNAVTEYADHHASRRQDTNPNEAMWFGSGAKLKEIAWNTALELAVK